MLDVTDQRCHPVVPETARVDGVRDEVLAQRVHLHERGQSRHVAVVVSELALGHGRAGGRFDGHDPRLRPGQVLADERERQTGEVGAAPGAPEDEVGRGLPEHLELFEGLLADDRLVQAHVVEDGTQGVAGLGVARRHLDRLRHRHTQRTGGVGVLGEEGPARLGQVGGARVDGRAEGLHEHPAVRLGLEGRLDLPDLHLDAEGLTGERQRRAPLTGAGLGGELGDALRGVVVRLGHGRVGLV